MELTEINGILELYKDIELLKINETKNINLAIKLLQEKLTELSKPFEDRQTEILDTVRPWALENQSSYDTKFAKIIFRKGVTRRSWNLDALDQICEAKPEIANVIIPFKTVTVGDPSVKIEVKL